MSENPNAIRIKVRSLNSTQFELTVSDSMLVSDLQEEISSHTQIPADRQRLICQGKLLKSEDPLSVYKLADGHVIQLLASAPPAEPAPEEPEALSDIIRLAVDSSPVGLLPRPRRRFQRRREIDNQERLETIRQSLLTLDSMLNSLTSRIDDPDNVQGFSLPHRHFSVGQWVDVKDTVDQWLESQVVDIQMTPGGPLLYIHYNGWPTRWDEWIEASSPRVQYLRTHTLQSLASPMQSPHPVIPCDAEGVDLPSVHNASDYIVRTSEILEQVRAMMDMHYSLSVIVRHEQADERVEPLRRRLGVEERKEMESFEASDATAANDIGDIGEIPGQVVRFESGMTPQQQLTLLTVQLAPLLDRTGRIVTDLASVIAGNHRPADDTASVVTNESGVSNVSARPFLQVPVMPSPLELASINPRSFGSDIDIHVHAIFSQRGRENPVEEPPERNACWRQIS